MGAAPGRFGPILAEPTILPSSTATIVAPGGCSIHQGRASSRVWPSGNAYVLPSVMIAA